MTRIPDALKLLVRKRANYRCEYCGLPEGFSYYSHQIDHIIPIKHRGTSDDKNLALACFNCNNNKGSDVASYDEITKELTPLYNPRMQSWHDHFQLENAAIMSISPIGRVTVFTLDMNHPDQLETREELIKAGVW